MAQEMLRDLVVQESTEALARELKAKPGSLNAKMGMVSLICTTPHWLAEPSWGTKSTGKLMPRDSVSLSCRLYRWTSPYSTRPLKRERCSP